MAKIGYVSFLASETAKEPRIRRELPPEPPSLALAKQRLAKSKGFWASLTDDQKAAAEAVDAPEVAGDPKLS
jgi:hypothetical protein